MFFHESHQKPDSQYFEYVITVVSVTGLDRAVFIMLEFWVHIIYRFNQLPKCQLAASVFGLSTMGL